jgi:hypothetical protein
MTTYYFEGSPIVAPLTITSNEPVFASDSLNLKPQRTTYDAQRWELSFSLQQTGGEEEYFSAIIQNRAAARTMVMPQLYSIDKKAPSTAAAHALVSIDAAVGSSSVTATCATNNVLIPKGSFVKFSNHSKIYMLTANVTTTGGAVVFSVYPKLRMQVPSGTSLYHPYSSVKPTLSYYQSLEMLQGITYSDGIMVDIGSINIIEAL